MISTATAVRYDGFSTAGRNNPLRVLVETDDELEYEVFLKPSGKPELSVSGLAHEAIAACLAAEVGLPICRPFFVRMSGEWIGSIPDQAIREMLEHSNPVAFGSLAAGVGWRQWSSDDILTAGRRPTAISTLAFDAFTENPDRKPSNPNILVKGDDFRLIDHELALHVRILFPPPAPWREGGLSHLVEPDGHVFASRLRGSAIDFSAVRTSWSRLTDHDLDGLQACLPPEWAEATESVTAALTHVRAVRDRIDECLVEIGRALA